MKPIFQFRPIDNPNLMYDVYQTVAESQLMIFVWSLLFSDLHRENDTLKELSCGSTLTQTLTHAVTHPSTNSQPHTHTFVRYTHSKRIQLSTQAEHTDRYMHSPLQAHSQMKMEKSWIFARNLSTTKSPFSHTTNGQSGNTVLMCRCGHLKYLRNNNISIERHFNWNGLGRCGVQKSLIGTIPFEMVLVTQSNSTLFFFSFHFVSFPFLSQMATHVFVQYCAIDMVIGDAIEVAFHRK